MRAMRGWTRLGAALATAALCAMVGAQDVLSTVWARAGVPRTLHQAVFSPDGQRVAIAGAGIVVPIVRVRDGLVEREIRLPEFDRATTVAFSPNGEYLAVGTQVAAIWILRLADGQPVQVLYPHSASIAAVAFSPDGRYLVSSDGNLVQVSRLSDGAIVRTINHPGARRCLFTPNGNIVATVSDISALFWSFPDGALLRTIPIASSWGSTFAAAAFSPDGLRFATPSQPGNLIRLLNVADGALLQQATYDARALRGLTFTSDGNFLISGHENAVILWDAATLTPLQRRNIITHSVAASPNPNQFLTTNQYFTRLWDVQSFTSVNELSSFLEAMRDMVFSPSGSTIITTNQEFVRVWDAATGALLGGVWLQAPAGAVAVSPADESLIAVGGRFSGVGLYNLRTNQWGDRWTTNREARQLEFSPNGAILAMAISNAAIFHRVGTNTRFTVSRPNDVWGVRWLDNQRCLILEENGNLILWNTAQNQQERLLALARVARGVTVTPNRRFAAVNLQDRVALVDLRSWTLMRTVSGVSSPILAAQLTPNGRYLIAGDEAGRVLVWRVADGALVFQDTSAMGLEMDSAINRVAVAPTGSLIAYTRSDGMLFTARSPFPVGDANGDGCVNDADLLLVLFNFGGNDPQADLNADGTVDDSDLLQVLFEFGFGCE